MTDTDPNVGLFFGLCGGLVACVGVPLFFAFLGIQLWRAKRAVAGTAAEVETGTVADLLPWHAGALRDLTREWVGASTYTSGLGGRTDEASGRVPSGRTPTGWLLAFSMTARNRGADASVRGRTGAHALDLRIAQGTCWVTCNAAALGTVALRSGELRAPDGSPLGTYTRDAGLDVFVRLGPGPSAAQLGGRDPLAHLVLRGRTVATLDTRTTSDTDRPRAPSPLVTDLGAPIAPDEETWILALAVLELAYFGPRLAHDAMRRV